MKFFITAKRNGGTFTRFKVVGIEAAHRQAKNLSNDYQYCEIVIHDEFGDVLSRHKVFDWQGENW